jgi:hypothetical protein
MDGTDVLARYSGQGSPKGPFEANPYIAVDQSNGHVVEFDNSAVAREYEASGAFVAEFGSFTDGVIRPYRVAIDNACAIHRNDEGELEPLDETTTPTCAQFDPANGTAYVAFDDSAPGTFDLTAFAPPSYGGPPKALTGIASGVGGGNATLNGSVNPNGFDLTDCHFEYSEDPGFAGAIAVPCVPSLATIGRGNAPVAVHADISGLQPEGHYYFRLAAANKFGPSLPAGIGRFGPPLITTKPALPVLYSEATLRASVDPFGLATEYRFEYGNAPGAYDHSTPLAKLGAGAAKTDVAASLTGLAEGAEYHFRIVVENEAKTIEGPDQSFETLQRPPSDPCPNVEYRTGLSANLPDCRAYELTTPAETNGLEPASESTGKPEASFNNWLATPRGPGAGERLSYFTTGTLPGFEGNGFKDAYRAQRAVGEHPKEGWGSTLFAPSFPQSAPDVSHPPNQRGVSADQLYSFWAIQPAESLPGVLEGNYLRGPGGFELVGQGSLGVDPEAETRYLSSGGEHVIFLSGGHLQDEAPPAPTQALYDRAAGSDEAEVLSLLPGDVAPTESASYVGATEDGSAVVFRVGTTLYLRRADQSTALVQGPSTFAGISADGGRVFYADIGGEAAPATLYACEVGEGSCVDGGKPGLRKVADASIFLNVSPDGSGVIFTSKEALTGSEANEAGEVAEAEKRNLYSWDADTGATSFVAQLEPKDFESFGGNGFVRLNRWVSAIGSSPLIGRADSPTRATPDGRVFVFQSHAQLTAYDNAGHGEVYRYEPAADPGGRLLCVSCDPANAPASADAMLADPSSPQVGVTRSTQIANVTDDGQAVFFESPDQLLPEDANDVVDVYEWKADGAGGCERLAGCLGLISSGQGEGDSYLYAMSADGHDVFFRTRERLVGADVPGSPSIYDARIGGGIPEPPSKEPCQGDACQGNGTIPPLLPTPGASGSDPGNLPAGNTKPPCPKGKHKVKKGGKTRCVKRAAKKGKGKGSKQSRASHDRGAKR